MTPITENCYNCSRQKQIPIFKLLIQQYLGHENLSFLIRKDIMDCETLENAVNGTFWPPSLSTRIRSLWRGLPKPSVLLKLNQAVTASTKIYHHYKLYPPAWNPAAFAHWNEKTEKLFRGISQQPAPP